MNKWDGRFLELAEFVSRWSKDPSTQVGAVIVDSNKKVLGLGYNGFAAGVVDSEERLNNRDIKYPLMIHAEINAINTARCDLTGATLYTHGLFTCARCAAVVINSGIKRVVTLRTVAEHPRWNAEFELAMQQYQEAGVEVDLLG